MIQGAGGLGCYAAALATHAGARRIIATDIDAKKLAAIRDFGATDCIDVSSCSTDEFVSTIRELTGGFGADCALELAGVPSVVPPGLASLRKGGRYVEIGCTFPEAVTELDLSTLLWNLLTIRGVHNYDFRHLAGAVDFVSQTIDRFPYPQLISEVFPLSQINDALRLAKEQPVGRIAVVFP